MKSEVETFLKENDIEYVLHEHKAVYTCEEAEEHCGMIGGISCKNLFVKDKKAGDYFLVVLPAEKRADLKKIQQLIGVKKITFAKPEELLNVLALEPGSVSPLGLLNDKEKQVMTYIDSELWEADAVSFHPNINTETLEFKQSMFHKVLDDMKVKFEIIEL